MDLDCEVHHPVIDETKIYQLFTNLTRISIYDVHQSVRYPLMTQLLCQLLTIQKGATSLNDNLANCKNRALIQ